MSRSDAGSTVDPEIDTSQLLRFQLGITGRLAVWLLAEPESPRGMLAGGWCVWSKRLAAVPDGLALTEVGAWCTMGNHTPSFSWKKGERGPGGRRLVASGPEAFRDRRGGATSASQIR